MDDEKLFRIILPKESGRSSHSLRWQLPAKKDAALISPSGLVIAITIIRQVADVGAIHAHDEDVAGLGAFF